ncbi:glutaredoxin family protein [Shimia sp.]|uniref:glutaredoxin family protein n=1 Tax=Shimia sp. TaxID=1954381 RepID=UPI003BA9BBBE
MKFKIYGHHQCPWCDKAVDLLNDKGLRFSYLNVRANSGAREDLIRMGYRTVPQVFLERTQGLDLEHIGGFEDLEKYLKDNQ